MSLYKIKIDGQIIDKIYTYDELQKLNVLDFDDIYIRKTSAKKWIPANRFVFSNNQPKNYHIDEYGQIVREDYPKTIDSRKKQSSSDRPMQPPTSNMTSSNSNAQNATSSTAWKICGTIVVIAIAVGLCIAFSITSPAVAYGTWKAIESIWND